MAGDFEDIKIKEFDNKASSPSGEGALMRLVLRLSRSVPPQWSEYFNAAWRQHVYMMKRKAWVDGGRLEIICMPDELEGDHLPELQKIIAETNDAYRSYVASSNRRQAQAEEQAKQQREQLSKLKDRLKFD